MHNYGLIKINHHPEKTHTTYSVTPSVTNSLAQKISRDFGFYGLAAKQNGFT